MSNKGFSPSILDLEQKLQAVLDKKISNGQLKNPLIPDRSEHQKVNPSDSTAQREHSKTKIDD